MVEKRTIIIIAAITFFVVMGMFFIGAISLLLYGTDEPAGSGNVAVIPIEGTIVTQGSSSLFGEQLATSEEIVKMIEKADDNPQIKAILFQINSPGGSAVASDEIAQAIKATNKTTVAWIREIGTSGAYWVASSCDIVVANRMSITGSIGVIASYLEFSGLMDDYNITYQRLVSGKFKDVGSPFRPLTSDEEELLQDELDQIHEYFVAEVAANRNLPLSDVRTLATGMFYIGSDAKAKGLVDVLGGRKEAVTSIEERIGTSARLVEYRRKPSLMDLFGNVMQESSFYIGRGFAFQISQDPSAVPHISV
jgi:protease IV